VPRALVVGRDTGDRKMTAESGLSATELIAHYRTRELSPVEVTKAVLARIEQHGHSINAFALLDPSAAMAAARVSELRWRRGEPLGLLDGVPMSVKDLLLARGWPTRKGSLTVDAGGTWDEDSPAVARLREHGAVILGKTTTSEFGLKGLGDSPLTGITRNPWNVAHSPGGSSAGAVAAVAAGMSTLAVGTDGGGSIRVPSAFTGVIGLKPTYGRVPAYPAMVVGAPPHVGPIARTVTDVALLLTVLVGPDDRDPFRLPRTYEDYRDQLELPLEGLRLGVSRTLGYADVDPEIAADFERAIRIFEGLGASVETADPGFESPEPLLRTLFAARAAATVRHLTAAKRKLLDPAVQLAAMEGEQLSAVRYLEAEEGRVALAERMAAYHRRFDLLLTPTTAETAPLAEPEAEDAPARRARSPFAQPFSLTRQPALSIPMGVTKAGLPTGLQIVGRHFEDKLVLRAAHAFESQQSPASPAFG
jgi:aspartyl-tRNA(Asn)/glutamyl-tRNA(Gln) amidotransferase subunit A